ncbi:hypothetical protein BK131_12020 [Paenibacillus amylolyticus]|uniref:DUF4825 domain-containing protein n=1 Tax=Paenibacillus amylolyticus TaxID=1451 RepID=A0A1R1BWP9_PAEAM|nr:DUF4825 domain-containing protein [Paenibacillus amylolyticus]OMF14208.1 hypothetical protein BK131_12020 [Paenibacillus amylolyticus]
MTIRNIWIITIVVLGIIGLVIVEGFVNPTIEAKQDQYQAEQQNPLTHDFTVLAKYRSPYMGDNSNLSHLNQALPLHEKLNGYQLYLGTFTAQVNYSLDTREMNAEELERILVYNAVANFVMIDNLQTVVYQFENTSQTLRRESAQQWTGTELKELQNPELWNSTVREKLVEPTQVKEAFSQIVDN